VKGNSSNQNKKDHNVDDFDSKKSNTKENISFKMPIDDSTGENSEKPGPPIGAGGGGGVKNLSLGTIKSSRKTLARLIKSFHKDEISSEKIRIEIYAFTVLFQGFKTEEKKELEIDVAELWKDYETRSKS